MSRLQFWRGIVARCSFRLRLRHRLMQKVTSSRSGLTLRATKLKLTCARLKFGRRGDVKPQWPLRNYG